MDWTLAATPVLLILGGATLLGVLAMNRRTKLEIDHRVGLVAKAPKSSTPAKADSWLKGASGTLNNRLRRVVGPQRDLANQLYGGISTLPGSDPEAER